MVNLSTIYGVTIVLGSLAAMGSAYVGTKVYPIQKGGDPLVGPALLGATITGAIAAAQDAVSSKPEELAVETTKETPPEPENVVPETTEPDTSSTENVVPETTEPDTSLTENVVPETPSQDASSTVEEEKKGGKRLPPWFKH